MLLTDSAGKNRSRSPGWWGNRLALEEYRRKRDFHKTPEPAGTPGARNRVGAALSFVVQKHAARRLHYDFRLELEGVLKSWAVPKGPSLDPAEKRLAVEVEDHPLEYGGFEGVIPEREYGGGTVQLWDRGTWIPADPDPAAAWRKGALKFTLHGKKLHGNWALVRMSGGKRAGDRHQNWLLIKERDEAAIPNSGDAVVVGNPLSVETGRTLDAIANDRDRVWHSRPYPDPAPLVGEGQGGSDTERPAKPLPARRLARVAGARKGPMPNEVKPQLATLTERAPEGPEWLHEIKYDGYRLLAHIGDGKVRLLTRSGLDWTAKFPELAHAFAQMPLQAALIDGEVVQLMPDGTTSFSALQDAIATCKTGSLTYFAFDLFHLDGTNLTAAALIDRKAVLAEIIPPQAQGMLRYSDHQQGQGPAFLREVCKSALEGTVSKRRDTPYQPGRGTAWRKAKCGNREEFVILGFTDPEGRREGFSALLLGYYDPAGSLRYAGRVGTGFNTAQLAELRRRLEGLGRAHPPVVLPAGDARKGVHWVEPSLVAQIQFADWTADALVRQASFQGLREDKSPHEVVHDRGRRETPAPTAAPRSASSEPPAPAISERARDGSLSFAGVQLTHPDRVLYPELALTKLDLARYYAAVRDWALPQLAHRPLTLVRSPSGRGGKSFYQKHLAAGVPEAIGHFDIAGDDGIKPHPVVEDLAGLIGLVQMGVLEIHPWGATVETLETPDRVTFDLDPDEGLPWARVTEAAIAVRQALLTIGLEAFVKTTGGKGLHVVVPLLPELGWDPVKAFSKWVADQLAAQSPQAFTTNQAKRARQGRIYIDYLRNGRGATAIGAYSPRARPGAPVSTPLVWAEVEQGVRPEVFTVASVPARLVALKTDPWGEIGKTRQSINAAVRRHIGV